MKCLKLCVLYLDLFFFLFHKFCAQGPTTARETSFAQVFGRELHEAREGCRRYRAYGDASGLDKAWDIYYGVCLSFPVNRFGNINISLSRFSEKLKSNFLNLQPWIYNMCRQVF
jgi:hypothetical protein